MPFFLEKGNEIIEHLRKKQENDRECLEEQKGGEREEEPGRKEGGERHAAVAAAVETMRWIINLVSQLTQQQQQ